MSLRFYRLFSLLSAGTLLLVSLSGHAASFDCAKATSVTEKAICADEELSALDEKLAVVWKKASGFNPVAMKSSQLQWLKFRDDCGAVFSCLSARYSMKLIALERVAKNEEFPVVGTDQAGNRLEALIPETHEESTDADARRCTADKRFCVQLLQEALIQIDYVGANPATYSFALPDLHLEGNSRTKVTLWSSVLRLAGDDGAILVGVEYTGFHDYLGGGSGARELQLFRVSRNETAFHVHEVLSVLIGLWMSSRTCYSEQDVHDQLGACGDDHQFNASIGLDRTVKSGFPRFVYQTHAMNFPRKVSRPLRKQDLVYDVDPHCTYKRTFRFENTTGTYVPDKPLPDCSDFGGP